MKIKLFILLNYIFFLSDLNASSFLTDYKSKKAYEKNDYEKVKNILQQEQVDNPDDAQLNYNLGTVYYKLNKFAQAKENLQRAIVNCSKDEKGLKEYSYFNLGNSFYKSCLSILGVDWEKKEKIDDQKLDLAISEVKQSIENYKNVLVLDKENQKAKFNLKKAEELLKKLEEKKQKQQQNQQQKQDQDQKKDQENQNKQQDQQNSKDNKSGQKQKNDRQQSSPEEKQNDENEQERQNQENNESDQRDDNRKESSDNKSENEQSGQQNQDRNQHDQNSSDEQKNDEQANNSEENSKQEQEQKQGNEEQQSYNLAQAQEGQQEESMKEKGVRVLLDSLQADESKLQKKLINKMSKTDNQNLNSYQKPW